MSNRSKVRLSPIQGQILLILEEAGEEYITTVLNTLKIEFPEVAPGDFIREAEQAIQGLIRASFVSFWRETGKTSPSSTPLSPGEVQQIFPLDGLMRWDEQSAFWVWDESRAGSHRVSVVLTESGQRTVRS